MSQSAQFDPSSDDSEDTATGLRMSARILGYGLGLNSQETNALLKDQGFLDGEPGAYSVTEKGQPYATEKFHSRGTGGSIQYNPSGTTTTWDESIKDELDVSEDKKREIRQQVADRRRALRAPEPEAVEERDQAADDSERGGTDPKVVIAAVGALTSAFGLYKAAPNIKKFVTEKVAPRFKRAKGDASDEAGAEDAEDNLSSA